MGYAELIGLTGEERREALLRLRAEANTLPPRPREMHEGLVDVQVWNFVNEWSEVDLANDEVPDEAKQRRKNRVASHQSQKTRVKNRRYWERPTEEKALKKK